MKLLITGIHGFIGGGVGRVARGAGHEVLGLDLAAQAPGDWAGRYAQLDAAHADVAPLVRDFAPDAVLHAAGTASVGQSYKLPLDDLRAAVLTWANVLDGIRRSAVRPVVLFPSSAAVYGNPEELPVPEDAPVRPISPYGFHKAACELIGWEHTECFDLDVVLGRLFSVYGPGQRRLLLWELYERAVGPEPEIALLGTGKETRDYLHVDDVARALIGVATKRPRGLTVVNVASGEAIETGALAALVARAAGVDKPVGARGAERAGDPAHWRADVGRLRSMGAYAHRPLEEGVRACVEAWR